MLCISLKEKKCCRRVLNSRIIGKVTSLTNLFLYLTNLTFISYQTLVILFVYQTNFTFISYQVLNRTTHTTHISYISHTTHISHTTYNVYSVGSTHYTNSIRLQISLLYLINFTFISYQTLVIPFAYFSGQEHKFLHLTSVILHSEPLYKHRWRSVIDHSPFIQGVRVWRCVVVIHSHSHPPFHSTKMVVFATASTAIQLMGLSATSLVRADRRCVGYPGVFRSEEAPADARCVGGTLPSWLWVPKKSRDPSVISSPIVEQCSEWVFKYHLSCVKYFFQKSKETVQAEWKSRAMQRYLMNTEPAFLSWFDTITCHLWNTEQALRSYLVWWNGMRREWNGDGNEMKVGILVLGKHKECKRNEIVIPWLIPFLCLITTN